MTRRRRAGQIVVGLLLAAGLLFGGVYRLRVLDQHERALIVAARWGDAHTVQVLLAQGVDPNTRDVPQAPTDWRTVVMRLFHRQSVPNREQYTPALLVAAKNYNSAVVRMLLRAGADPNATDTTGKRSLILAINEGDAETALLLLAKGANPNTQDVEDRTTALLKALEEINNNPSMEAVAQELITRGADIKAKDENGGTVLLRSGHSIAITQCLLEKGIAVNAVDNEGNTALMKGAAPVTELLLQHGANINAKNSDGETALLQAGERNDFDKVKVLLKHNVDWTPVHNKNWNLLFSSARAKRPDIVALALSRGFRVNMKDAFHRTPLMFAAVGGDAKTISLLVAKGAQVDAQDKAGMTALMYAAQEDHAETVHQLMQYGANLHLKDREKGWTPSERAQHFGCEDVADFFRTGSVPPTINVNSKLNRVPVDAVRSLVSTPLARKDDPAPQDPKYFDAYSVRLVSNAGQQGPPVIVHSYKERPAMFAFQDVDKRLFVYIGDHTDYRGGAIYLAGELKLSPKWEGHNKYGMGCVPLRHGGARIFVYEPGHYEYGFHSPRTNDSAVSIARFRNGVVTELGTIDSP